MTKKPLPTFAVQSEGDTHTVMRDGTPLLTPRSLPVALPTRRLADAVAAEGREQTEKNGERMDLRQMPMTQLALTAIDIARAQKDEIAAGIIRYGETELLCQRAAEPPELAVAQQAAWQPYLDWCRDTFDAELKTGTGIAPFAQDPVALEKLREHVRGYEPFRLTGLSEAVGISGSLVLGLALATGHADAEAVLKAAEFDRLWQVGKWGEDPVVTARLADIGRELGYCARWFALLG